MSINVVLLDGQVKSPALRYDANSRPEFRFTLAQQEHAADGKTWTSYWPCCASGAAAERLASEIEEGQHIVITSGKLCYRKRTTKVGEQSRIEILVWSVERVTKSAAVEFSRTPESASDEEQAALNLGHSDKPAATPKRKPTYSKHLREAWQPEHAN